MKLRLALRCVFTTILVIIIVLLLVIFFDKAGTRTGVLRLSDYVIENYSESDTCVDMIEYVYEKDGKRYYLPCPMSNDIVLVWDDGSRDYLKDALRNEKVTVKSLQEHGLRIYEED